MNNKNFRTNLFIMILQYLICILMFLGKKPIYIVAIWFITIFAVSSFAQSTGVAGGTAPIVVRASNAHLNTDQAGCLVPCDQIVSGGPPKDGIPAIEVPVFLNTDDPGAPNDDDLVVGVVIDGVARAYPYDILNWHEIVNDIINGVKFSVTLCPLTGSAIVYDTSAIDDSTLGTSGKLYENNLVFYDRVSDTYWSQMLRTGIKGEKTGEQIPIIAAVETTWRAWKTMNPDTEVLGRDTGYIRDYDRYPYGSYESDSSINFPTTFNPNIAPYNLYHEKEQTQIIQINDKTLLLPFEELAKSPVLNHRFQETNLVNFFVEAEQLVISYKRTLGDGTLLEFKPSSASGFSLDQTFGLPIYEDQTGSVWNIKGKAIAGLYEGEQLEVLPTYNAMWFAASSFFYDALIFVGSGVVTSGTVTSEEVTYDSFSVDPEFQEADPLNFPTVYLTFATLIAAAIALPKLRKRVN